MCNNKSNVKNVISNPYNSFYVISSFSRIAWKIKALLQQNILSVTFVISFFHPRIYSCQFFPVFPRVKKNIFLSTIWSTEQSTFICTLHCYIVIAWCMFLKLEARAQYRCSQRPEVVTTSFPRAPCSCRATVFIVIAKVFKIFKHLTHLIFISFILYNYYVRKSAFTPKVNIPAPCDRTLFLEATYIPVSAGYSVSKSLRGILSVILLLWENQSLCSP